MKNRTLILSAFFIALTVTSCSKKPQYTLKGTVHEGPFDGKEIVFCKKSGETIQYDTVQIKNNSFEWKVSAEQPQVVNSYLQADSVRFFRVVLENGHATVDIYNNDVIVGGSELNNVLQNYLDEEKKAYTTLTDLSAAYQSKEADSAATEEMKAEYLKNYQEISEKFGDYTMDFIKANINNVVGKTYFSNMIIHMDAAGKEKMLSFATDDLKALYKPKN